jgi:predicted outer membrane repeat protein
MALALLVLLPACGAEDPAGPLPSERHVRVPEDYPDLFTAIAAWNSGDTISLAAGTFAGAGFRGLELDGRFVAVVARDPASPPVLDLEESGPAFLLVDDSSLYLRDIVLRNGLHAIGGALRVTESAATLDGVRIEGCAARYGGAIVAEDAELALRACVLAGNTATEIDGGAIYATRSAVALEGTLVTGNRAQAGGGAVSVDRSEFAATTSTFAGNAAATGGAFRIARDSEFALALSIVAWNRAEDDGDAAVVAGSATLVAACTALDTLAVVGAAIFAGIVASDPRFCDPVPALESPTTSGDWGIAADSPCSAALSPCGARMGAREPSCGPLLRVAGAGVGGTS